MHIYPRTRSTGSILPGAAVTEDAYLCTPKGERYYLKPGGMPPHIYLHTVGLSIYIYMYNWKDTLPIGADSRPSFELHGRWGQGELTADDHNTLSIAFLSDGTLRPKGAPAPPSQLEELQMTLREGTYAEFRAACSARGR